MRPSIHQCFERFGKTKCIGAEIGVEMGHNAFNIINEWDLTDGAEIFLYLVDINKDIQETVVKNLEGREEYKFIIGDSQEVSKQFEDEFFDWVYLDDDHSSMGVRKSLGGWYPKIKVGGIICGHDFNTEEVEDAVRGFFARNNLELHVDGNDWWGIKIAPAIEKKQVVLKCQA